MHRNFLLLLVGGFNFFLVGCQSAPVVMKPTPESNNLIVFAAASLTKPFNEIADRFEAEYPSTTIANNFAGSQQLAQQLAQGAPADVFASADDNQMNTAVQEGRVVEGSPQIFAGNRLVVIFPSDNPANILTLRDLARPGLRLLLADVSAPVGRYSLEFLDKATQQTDFGTTFKEYVLHNVVSYEENVKAVLSKVILGEADAGIVYVSDAANINSGEIGRLEIPVDLNVVARYWIAPIKDSQHGELAREFIAFVLSSTGQDILVGKGFSPVR